MGFLLDYLMNRIWQDEWEKYQTLVKKITEENDLSILENCDRRGMYDYHLDHIVPIQQGFFMNINPHLIGSLENLQFIDHRDNMDKSYSLTEKSHMLLSKWGVNVRERKREFRESWKRIVYSQDDNPKLLKRIKELEDKNNRLEQENKQLHTLVDLMKVGYYESRVRDNKVRRLAK